MAECVQSSAKSNVQLVIINVHVQVGRCVPTVAGYKSLPTSFYSSANLRYASGVSVESLIFATSKYGTAIKARKNGDEKEVC